MIHTKTRVRLTWTFVGMCTLGMALGAWLKEPGVINSSLAACSAVVIMYIGGKTFNNNKNGTIEK